MKYTAPSATATPAPGARHRSASAPRHLRQQQGLTLRALADKSGPVAPVPDGRRSRPRQHLGPPPRRSRRRARRRPAPISSRRTPDEDAAPRVIALLGLRGAGKTTIGRRLARRSGCASSSSTSRSRRAPALRLAGDLLASTARTSTGGSERDTLADLLNAAQSMVLAVGGGLVTAARPTRLLLPPDDDRLAQGRGRRLLDSRDAPGRSPAHGSAPAGARGPQAAGHPSRAALRPRGRHRGHVRADRSQQAVDRVEYAASRHAGPVSSPPTGGKPTCGSIRRPIQGAPSRIPKENAHAPEASVEDRVMLCWPLGLCAGSPLVARLGGACRVKAPDRAACPAR